MKKEELAKVVDFYENVIQQFIIKPQDINEIYLLVEPNGELLQPYFKKQRAISLYVQGLKQQVLDGLEDMFEEVEAIPDTQDPRSKNYIPEDSAASPAVRDDTQSHTEATNQSLVGSEDGDSELEKLEKQYENAKTPNEKRSLKARINRLKKAKKV